MLEPCSRRRHGNIFSRAPYLDGRELSLLLRLLLHCNIRFFVQMSCRIDIDRITWRDVHVCCSVAFLDYCCSLVVRLLAYTVHHFLTDIASAVERDLVQQASMGKRHRQAADE